ncbi:hypothetical protein [Rhodovastum atsumiense]|uniref:Lipoprotein n=1 Tax=Rhodovastum atsumiense TaxID=504468 RepID=A0A5M6IRY3_9PROT|nr:hypothetical protein [Rhodovastum atsumiense]KAA5610328.1 hypothetical protein F1189_19655 [Rhodovastum atsumiense]
MRKHILVLPLLAGLAACAASQPQFVASKKSAVELRSIQVRTISADADTAMRGVIETLHDLGYRITRVESDARTVSATRQTTLRMAVVVQPRGPAESTVRANASMIAPGQEAQVDSAEFYQRNFFAPLGATLGRSLASAPADITAPEAPRPVAEINTAREREAAARQQAKAPANTAGASPR